MLDYKLQKIEIIVVIGVSKKFNISLSEAKNSVAAALNPFHISKKKH